jgi:Zn-finger nucleic acid-binding protein
MKCPVCKTVDLVKAKTKSQGFHMEHCPDCKGIWFERIEIERILLKLNEIIPSETSKNKTHTKEGHSPIIESIYASKELYYLRHLKGKPHWIHRLFD